MLVEAKLALYDREREREAFEEAIEAFAWSGSGTFVRCCRSSCLFEVARERVEVLLEQVSTGMM